MELLLQLNEPPAELCDAYILQASHQLNQDLKRLSDLSDGDAAGEERVRLTSDVLEFADTGCNTVLSNAALLIANFTDLFMRRRGDVV